MSLAVLMLSVTCLPAIFELKILCRAITLHTSVSCGSKTWLELYFLTWAAFVSIRASSTSNSELKVEIVGTDVRKAALDGWPVDRVIGSDLHQGEFVCCSSKDIADSCFLVRLPESRQRALHSCRCAASSTGGRYLRPRFLHTVIHLNLARLV